MPDSRPEARADQPAASPSASSASKRRRPGRLRLWLFRAIALLLIPALLLAAVEGSLRLLDYGPPTGFFVAIEGDDVLATNELFGWRFFPPAIARTPTAERLSRRKPADTYRIFILGGSAAQGTPSRAFNFERILEVMLGHRYPGVRFEVINAAMTAINSHVVLPIARECAALDPDLLLVYMGNNEVVGPYGAGTVFGAFSPNLTSIRASIALRTTGLGKLLHDLATRLHPPDRTDWGGLEMFQNNHVPADDPRLARVYDHFSRNLTDICQAGLDAGAKVLVSTVAVNLRDNPPFGSSHRPNLTEAQLTQFSAHLAAAQAAEDAGDFDAALASLTQALHIDDRNAEVHYHLGLTCLALGRERQAIPFFEQARDLDTLRFRADSRINAIIREIGASLAHEGVILADVEQALAAAADVPGLPGDEFFQEHVHPHFAGDWWIAKALFDALAPHLPAQVQQHAVAVPIPDPDACATALAYTPWVAHDIESQMIGLMNKPPFTLQLNHERTINRRMAAWRAAAPAFSGPEALAAAELAARHALGQRPTDIQLHIVLAETLRRQNKREEELAVWEWLVEWMPNVAWWHDRLAVALGATGRSDQALPVFETALKLDPLRADTLYNYGTALIRLGRFDEAVARLSRAIALKPGTWIYHFNLANAYRGLGDHERSVAALRDAMAIEPDNPRILHALAWFLIEDGQIEPAVQLLGCATELSDHYADDLLWAQAESRTPGAGLTARAAALLRQGDVDNAYPLLALALQRNPRLPDAHYGLAQVEVARQRWPQAAAHLREAVRLDPHNAPAMAMLGQVQHRLGNTQAAIDAYEKTLELDPDRITTLNDLARLYAAHPIAALRNGPRAITLAQRAVELGPSGNYVLLDTLAMAHAETGDFDQALTLVQRALDAARGQPPQVIEALRRHLIAFQARRPWREDMSP